MTDQTDPQSPEIIGFLLVPDFPMLGFSSAIEPLRIANWITGRELYVWRVMSKDGEPVRASNGCLLTPHFGMQAARECSQLLICAGVNGCYYRDRQVFALLRSLARKGVRLGGLSTATYILARAGVMSGHRCTIHFEDIETLSTEFPDLDVIESLYELDDSRMTCSGGTAAMDMMLDLIAAQHGANLAGEIGDRFLKQPQRESSDSQRMSLDKRTGISDRRLLTAISAMEARLEEPLDLLAVCAASDLSLRHLQRLFKEQMGETPSDFYRAARLRRARQLLLHGSDSILDVALAAGFASASHFTRRYKEEFGLTPSAERRSQRQARTQVIRVRRP